MNIKTSLLIACAMAIVPVPVLATPGNSGGGNGGCGVGQNTNGCGGETTPPATGGNASVGPISNNVNNRNDVAVIGANLLNADLTNANNVNNRNDVDVNNAFVGVNENRNVNDVRNTNTNTNTNVSSNVNDNRNNNSNVNNNDNSNVNRNNASASSNQTQGQTQGQSQSTTNSNNSSVVVQGDQRPASTAIAPALVAGSDTCMGSSSAGGQGMAFGFSFGTSWTDKNCVRLKNARQLQSMGYNEAAVQLVCQNKDVQDAMRQAGTPCVAIRRKDD